MEDTSQEIAIHYRKNMKDGPITCNTSQEICTRFWIKPLLLERYGCDCECVNVTHNMGLISLLLKGTNPQIDARGLRLWYVNISNRLVRSGNNSRHDVYHRIRACLRMNERKIWVMDKYRTMFVLESRSIYTLTRGLFVVYFPRQAATRK